MPPGMTHRRWRGWPWVCKVRKYPSAFKSNTAHNPVAPLPLAARSRVPHRTSSDQEHVRAWECNIHSDPNTTPAKSVRPCCPAQWRLRPRSKSRSGLNIPPRAWQPFHRSDPMAARGDGSLGRRCRRGPGPPSVSVLSPFPAARTLGSARRSPFCPATQDIQYRPRDAVFCWRAAPTPPEFPSDNPKAPRPPGPPTRWRSFQSVHAGNQRRGA
jgi:hypothetical protein